MSKLPKLKPCPFCGGKAELHGGYSAYSCDSSFEAIECQNCGAWGWPYEDDASIFESASHWNSRADSWISVDEESLHIGFEIIAYIPLVNGFYRNIVTPNEEGDLYDCDGCYTGYHASQVTHFMKPPSPPKGE